MKIAMAGQTWGPVNGPGVFARRLAKRLAQRGHQILAIIPAPGIEFKWSLNDGVTLAQIPAIRVPFYPEIRITPAPLRTILKTFEKFRPDLLHIQDHYLLSRGALTAACSMGIPVIATNHFLPANILPHVPLATRCPPAARLAETFLWRSLIEVLERTKLVTTPTKTAAAMLRPHLGQMPVRAISCGIDLDQFRPPATRERTIARSHWRIDPCEVVFTYVGRLDFEKRVDVMVHAMARVQHPAVRLFVVGQGQQRSRLRRLIRSCRVGERVALLGFLEHSRLLSLLHASDFFAMPGDAELQSIATLEAMATGLPVLAANACALPEIIENGINGALFEPGAAGEAAQKIECLAKQRNDHWGSMSSASLDRVAAHSLDLTVSSYETVYQNLTQAFSCPAGAPPFRAHPCGREDSFGGKRS